MMVAVGHISTMGRLRKADPKQVEVIANSVKEVGLLNPITVVPARIYFNGQQIDGYQLVAGLHRLEACKSIGWMEIPATVLDLDEQRRILAECDENLCGTILTATERAMFTARRKEAYEALHPEVVNGRNQHSDRDGQLGQPSFADDQAAKTGQSARAIRRDAERGQQVCKEALDILKGTKADTGVVLDMLKDMEPEAQIEAAKAEVQKRQQPAPRPVDIESARRSKIDADVKERAAVAIAEWMVENADSEALDFLKANLFAAGANNIAVELTNLIGNSVMDKAGW
ncbi:ParB N-terminal domain-containing protein [Paracoccus sp. AS002]|uniref:ParB/RepB/Spo0J family partition protein n=1 Tax=Paracoccus sp. AS002 TaxID=3019545 RepID=UPI0023E814BB|nr:ParB N-terminal domain-containing protein [Paracoccus sp. AS002]MDF3904675.1 ParB N-terminal domain-containing protein [Paracoccus sp. AS002]